MPHRVPPPNSQQGSPSVDHFIPASSSKLRNQISRPADESDDEDADMSDDEAAAGPSSDVEMEDGDVANGTVDKQTPLTPSANRRQLEAAERKAARDKRKAQEGVLHGKRAGLEKAKVRRWCRFMA
jgi:hypothetical protein